MKVLLLVLPFLTSVVSTWSTEKRIFNSKDAPPLPYQLSVQILREFSFFRHHCGASILTPIWGLTAAHCLVGYEDSILRVVAGITNLEERNPERQDVFVDERIPHPDYSKNKSEHSPDIGLIKLEVPLKFGELVGPIALPVAGTEPRGVTVLAGWGAANKDYSDFFYPEQLQWANMTIIPQEDCSPRYVGGVSSIINVCASEEGARGCRGDSGGPLVQQGTVVGVASASAEHCKQAPTIFTKVSAFTDFIRQHVTDLP